jgi:2-polyprenyl-6-methoxyphenol hydroxylase-like FAD-dependent oxidoreductase
MKATVTLQVVIVGAGIGGLGTAISLRKAGHRVIVLEQAPEFTEVIRLFFFYFFNITLWFQQFPDSSSI